VSIKERFNLIARKLSIWNNFFPIKMSFFEALLAPNYHYLVLSQEIYHIERNFYFTLDFLLDILWDTFIIKGVFGHFLKDFQKHYFFVFESFLFKERFFGFF
jgi:hypothetical protein